MNKSKFLMVAGLGACLAMSASATQITIDAADLLSDGWILGDNYWTTADNSNQTPDQIEAIVGSSFGELEQLYKNDNPAETGPFSASYEVDFSTQLNDDNEPEGGEISYSGSGSVMTGARILVVKDGKKGEPAQYFFDITGWDGDVNGDMEIVLSNFWPAQGAISHVEILGQQTSVPGGGGTPGVPDGGTTMALFGLSLLGLGGVRRMSRGRKA